MKKLYLLTFLYILTSSINSIYAARPTQQASNLRFNRLNCNSVQLLWTKGDGAARVIFCKESTNNSFTPADGASYSANSIFKNGPSYPSSNDSTYAVYNGTAADSITITNLKEGKTYFFSFFEHDNTGSNTLYLTNNFPSITITTYSVKLGFSVQAIDSCEKTNLFQINNTSTATVPGIQYYFEFNSDTIQRSIFTKHIVGNGYKNIILRTITSKTGCQNNLFKSVKIFPKKIGYFDLSTFKDSIQCYQGNYFQLSSFGYLFPFPSGAIYKWRFGENIKDSSTFPKMRKTYTKEGKYRVSLEITSTSYTKPTACKDTIYVNLTVLHNYRLNLQLDTAAQYLSTNRFIFRNQDTGILFQKWLFGDGDSSRLELDSHTYKANGSYFVKHILRTSDACSDTVTLTRLRVLADPINSLIALEARPFILYPNPSHGLINLYLPNPETYSELIVYNLQGKQIVKTSEISLDMQISLHELPVGIYTLQLTNKAGVITQSLFTIE